MAGYRTVLVPAAIERGGFGDERTYRVELADGGEHIGLAPWIYCLDENRKQVEDEPSMEQVIDGYVHGQLIRNGDGRAKVYFPDGAVCWIDADKVTDIAEDNAGVSVES